MDAPHLGPLERAALDALLATEALGVPALDPARLLACMAYGTHRANLERALQEGPLARYVATDGTRFCLIDSPEHLTEAQAAAERMDRVWTELQDTIRGLCKLPWVEAVAVVGPGALGQLPPGQKLQLRVVAEGGRVRAAAAALGLSIRARDGLDAQLALESIVDADHLERPVTSPLASLRTAVIAPVMNRAGWQAWLEANPALAEALPNHTWGDERDLGERFDGRLAVWRRSAVQAEDAPLLRSTGRRGGKRLLLDRLLESVLDRSAGTAIPVAPALATGAHGSRRAAVLAWTFDQPSVATEETPVVEAPEPPTEAADPGRSEPPERSLPEGPAPTRSTRRRGATRRPLRQSKGAAASSTGSRSRKRGQ